MSAYSSPVFSMSGVMPGESEMSHWKTAYINPDATQATPARRHRNRGPSFSMAGVMPGGSTMANWNTAYPNGESIYVAALRNAEQRAALTQGRDGTVVPALEAGAKVSVFVRPVRTNALVPPAAAA